MSNQRRRAGTLGFQLCRQAGTLGFQLCRQAGTLGGKLRGQIVLQRFMFVRLPGVRLTQGIEFPSEARGVKPLDIEPEQGPVRNLALRPGKMDLRIITHAVQPGTRLAWAGDLLHTERSSLFRRIAPVPHHTLLVVDDHQRMNDAIASMTDWIKPILSRTAGKQWYINLATPP